MKSHAAAVIGILISAITGGATFLFALHRQLAMVEVAASLATGVQLYLLSSSIGDWIENKAKAETRRLLVAGALTLGLILYFVIARCTQS